MSNNLVEFIINKIKKSDHEFWSDYSNEGYKYECLKRCNKMCVTLSSAISCVISFWSFNTGSNLIMKSSALFCLIFCLLTDEIWIALSCIYIIRLHSLSTDY